jgi:hypothetical protein
MGAPSIPKENITGLVVKGWIVDRYDTKGKWVCKCEKCGKEEIFRAYHLKEARVKICNHSNNKATHTFKDDLTGRTFGELKVIGFDIVNGVWKCKCSCGKEVYHTTYQLVTRGVKTCGHSSGVLKDLRGKKFGELIPIEYLGDRTWKCECSCGKITNVRTTDLVSGNTQSCGHLKTGAPVIDLTNQQFGNWTALKYVGNSYWQCKCTCGNIENVHSYTLRNGTSTRCSSPLHRVTDIKGRQFGELHVEEYTGNGFWKCKCSCGKTKNILGVNLRNGSTRSCGCMTDKLLRQTLFSRYNEICPSRVDNARSTQQIEILHTKELFNALLVEYTISYGKPDAYALADILGVSRYTIVNMANKYDLLDKIKIYYNSSKGENQVANFVRNIYNGEVIQNTKKILDNGKELDIYIPDKHIAIEFNGTYWHSTIYKDKYYHQQKTLDCHRQGIRLIHIFEYEWNDADTQQKIKNHLELLLSNNIQTIGARNTEVKEIDKQTAKEFIDKYHLQKYSESSVNIGCFYNNELIGALTLGHPRFNSEYQYEIIRFCWKDRVKVTGGLEKLFSYFIKNYHPKSIMAYSDISKFTGNCYTKIDFKPIKQNTITEPNYVWVDIESNQVLSRYQTQKKKLIANNLGTEEQTEDEIMDNNGFFKIYNSGNIKMQWEY